MSQFSREQIEIHATTLGFQVAALEKVLRLVELLQAFSEHPVLKDALALKGGTALNLFVFDLPRLSVDIDLNYIGEQDLAERARLHPALRWKALNVQKLNQSRSKGKGKVG